MEYPHEISSSDSEFTDSFIASDDELENGLTWDSEDSRPAAPSPPSTPSQNMSEPPDIRSRLRPRGGRPREPVVLVRAESQSDNDTPTESQTSTEGPEVPMEEANSSSDETLLDEMSDRVSLTTSSQTTSPSYQGGNSPRTSSEASIGGENYLLLLHSNTQSSDSAPFSPPSPVPSSAESLRGYGLSSVEHSSTESSQGFGPDSPEHIEDINLESEASRSPEPVVRNIEPPAEELNVNPLQENQPNNVLGPTQPTTVEPQSSCTALASNQNDESGVANSSILSEGDDGSLCSICMDPLTNSGKHRIVSLRCGHIFGQSCLERWIKVGCNHGAKRCPTCNKKACLKDIRILYLPKVVPLDTVERDRLIQEKEQVTAEKKMLEAELARCKLLCDLNTKRFEDKIKELDMKYQEALTAIEQLSRGKMPSLPVSEPEGERQGLKLALTHSVEIRKEGGCRVMAYNALTQQLVVSQQSGNTVFAGFGVRVLPSIDFQPTRFVLLHQKMIRDLSFHPEDRDLLLSVSLDTTAKLVDLATSTTVHTFKGDGPLWSCCWEACNPHLLLVGSQLGKVRQYDRRMMEHYLNMWEDNQNTTPVVALASAPSVASTLFPQGGFFSCRLNGVFAYCRHGDVYRQQELSLDGPFMSMRYDHKSQTLLTSSRPSSRSAYAKVNLNLVDVDTQGNLCTPQIYTFNCGSSARVLSRLATLSVADDSLVVAHHESGRMVNMWSTKSGNLVHSCPIKEPVIDMTGISSHTKCIVSTLTDKRVNIYKVV